MSRELRICPGVGDRKCGAFLSCLDRDPHPTCTRCRGKVCTKDLTCDFCAVWSAEQWELFSKKRSYKERKRPSGSVPSAQQASHRAETSSGVSRPGTSSSSSRPLGGQGKQEGSRGAPGVVFGGAPSPPARPRSSERGGSASRQSSGAGGLAPSSPSPSGGGGAGVARSLQTPLSRVSDVVDSPQFSPHVPRRGNSRESSASCSRVLSSRGSRSSDRGSRKDKRARSRESSSRGRRRCSRALSSSRSRSRGRERRQRSSSASLSSRARSRRERSRSFDRYRSRRGSSRSRRDRSRSSDRYRSRRDRSRRERSRSDRYRSRRPALPSRSHDRSRSGGRLPGSPARLRAEEPGRLARRETQEGVEAVASQPPVVSGAAAGVTPVAGGASIAALPSVVEGLARFFMGLSSSSSLGAIGDIAGVTASAAASGGAVCPAMTAGGAATICAAAVTLAGAGVLPAAPAAVPSVSGEQQRQVESRSRGRRSRSSSDGTDRRAKKRSRRRSPSPERSSRRRGRRYRSSSDSSEEARADVSPPQSRRAHGGARTGGSSRDFDRSPRPGTSRSFVREDRYQSGASRRSPGPSGAVDDDRSTTFESVDFARDDSFRAVLGLIREFHDMAEPAGGPAARCKTSLTSAYGLMSETSPAFTLPASPLLSTLLLDINSDLSKFLEDQTVHGFLPVPGRRHRRYYSTSTSSFPGPYTVPPGVTSITLEKASEVKKRSVSLSASQVSSMETMLSGMCEVSSWLDW